MEQYDFIIAGGGIAGLSLAYHLINSPLKHASILIVDRDEKSRNDRTLSFWSTQSSLFEPVICQTWQNLRIAGPDFDTTATLDIYRYHTIRALDFYQFVKGTLRCYPNVRFVQGTISRIEDDGKVWVDGECYRGRWIFDSIYRCDAHQPEHAHYHHLEQHFHGWVIETPEPAFDPGTATLMDFRTEQKGEMRFFYVLPYSEREALIEYVLMSQDQCQPYMQEYVENVLGINDYRILSKEGGVSPLTDMPFPRRTGQHVMTIGTQGGRVKPSSGYAFTRIQADSAAIINSLVAYEHPFDVPPDSRVFRLYDRVMLDVMQRYGEALRPIFIHMFKHNPIERIFHLLDETASPREMLLLTLSMPSRYFLRAMFRLMILRQV